MTEHHSDRHDAHRWDSLDPADEDFVARALRAGREELPEEARLRAIEGRLGSALASETALSGWWSRTRLYPIVGLATLALGVSAGISSLSTPPGLAAMAVATSAPTATTEPAAVLAIGATPPVNTLAANLDAPTAIAIDALPIAESSPPSTGTAPVGTPQTGGAQTGGAPIAVPQVAKATTAAVATSGKVRPTPSPITTAPNGRTDELALLEEASRALESNPQKALALTDEHMNGFRAAKFAQERERLAVVALLRLGRREDAKRRAEAFEAAFPESAHLARIRELVRP